MTRYYIARIDPYSAQPTPSVWACDADDLGRSIRVPSTTPEARAFRVMANATTTGLVSRDTFRQRCIATTRAEAIGLLAASLAAEIATINERLRDASANLLAVNALADERATPGW